MTPVTCCVVQKVAEGKTTSEFSWKVQNDDEQYMCEIYVIANVGYIHFSITLILDYIKTPPVIGHTVL